MPNYQYTARDERGTAVSGTLAAPNPEALADALKRTGYLVTKSREVGVRMAVPGMAQLLHPISHDDLVLFNIQLSTMIRAGLPLVTALNTMTKQVEHPRLCQIITQMATSVESGSSFSDALKQHPAVFSALFTNMVHAGEASGKLDEVLRQLADFAKRESALRQQLRTAMTYPVVLLITGVGVCTYVVMSVVPKFMVIFEQAGVALPLPTRLLYQLSQFLADYWLLLIGGIGAVVIGLRWYQKTTIGRRHVDILILKVPVIGDLVRKVVLARLTMTLKTLIASGVPVLESLTITEHTCGNVVIGQVIRRVYQHVQQGGTIAEQLQASPDFPPMVAQMVEVGESSGMLDQMLDEIAVYYDERVEHGLKRLVTILEPVFLVVLGVVVAMIMASVLLPIFDMVSAIRR